MRLIFEYVGPDADYVTLSFFPMTIDIYNGSRVEKLNGFTVYLDNGQLIQIQAYVAADGTWDKAGMIKTAAHYGVDFVPPS